MLLILRRNTQHRDDRGITEYFTNRRGNLASRRYKHNVTVSSKMKFDVMTVLGTSGSAVRIR